MTMEMACAKKVTITQWMRGRAQEGKVREVVRGQAKEGRGDLLCGLCFILGVARCCWRIQVVGKEHVKRYDLCFQVMPLIAKCVLG